MTACQDLVPVEDFRYVVALLGEFRLLSGVKTIVVPRASQRLLVFLALHDGLTKRVTIAGSLWPNVSEQRAYSNLRTALTRLQRSARGAVVTSKLEISLADAVAVDIRCARLLARRLVDPGMVLDVRPLSLATVTALSADLLPGWYDEWVLADGEDWRQLRMHALEALARHLSAVGRWAEAASAACSAIRAEPLRESGHAALIRIHLAEGNQSEAVREFARYSTLLRDELDLEPTLHLRRLIEAMPGRQRGYAACAPSSTHGTWPGRS